MDERSKREEAQLMSAKKAQGPARSTIPGFSFGVGTVN